MPALHKNRRKEHYTYLFLGNQADHTRQPHLYHPSCHRKSFRTDHQHIFLLFLRMDFDLRPAVQHQWDSCNPKLHSKMESTDMFTAAKASANLNQQYLHMQQFNVNRLLSPRPNINSSNSNIYKSANSVYTATPVTGG